MRDQVVIPFVPQRPESISPPLHYGRPCEALAKTAGQELIHSLQKPIKLTMNQV